MLNRPVACPHCNARQRVGAGESSKAANDHPPALDSTDSANITADTVSDVSAEISVPKPMRKQGAGKFVQRGAVRSTTTPVESGDPARPSEESASEGANHPAANGGCAAESLDPELERLLPPKFLVPSHLPANAQIRSDSLVILPDATGGFRPVDVSVRQITVAGQTIAIANVPARIKRRRRLIRTIVIVALCGLILLAAFYWLSR